ncbi:MAG: hypothetical protein JW818_22025 [Pirellulales bacterium]|nr:hypothetical protein [Pirellulales bacterium]
MAKRILITALVIAAIHFVLLLGTMMASMVAGMTAFDDTDYEPPRAVRLADGVVQVLAQPAKSLWTPWMSQHMPNVVEWAFFLGNSFLWGLVLSLVLNGPFMFRRKNTQPAND